MVRKRIFHYLAQNMPASWLVRRWLLQCYPQTVRAVFHTMSQSNQMS